MKKIVVILLSMILFSSASSGQQIIPPDYLPPSGKINLSKDMPFSNAVQALNAMSSRLDTIVIIDEKIRNEPINVEIIDKEWREALLLIIQVNNLGYEEFPSYIKIKDLVTAEAAALAAEEVLFNSSMREINISAIFFEGDKIALKETGINWAALVQNENWVGNVEQPVAGQINANIIKQAEFNPVDQTLDAYINFLESQAIGEVLASPNIQVLEGTEGRVQVGQDFSIKQLDFAGNVTDFFRSTGIILIVRPQVINEDSLEFIHLSLSAERSSVTPSQISTIISKTQTSSSLFLLDGERAAIAGLYTTQENSERSGMPILKDLPWWVLGIRYFAGYEKVEQIEKELVIIVKAELVPTLPERELSMLSNREYLEQKKEELKKRLKK